MTQEITKKIIQEIYTELPDHLVGLTDPTEIHLVNFVMDLVTKPTLEVIALLQQSSDHNEQLLALMVILDQIYDLDGVPATSFRELVKNEKYRNLLLELKEIDNPPIK